MKFCDNNNVISKYRNIACGFKLDIHNTTPRHKLGMEMLCAAIVILRRCMKFIICNPIFVASAAYGKSTLITHRTNLLSNNILFQQKGKNMIKHVNIQPPEICQRFNAALVRFISTLKLIVYIKEMNIQSCKACQRN